MSMTKTKTYTQLKAAAPAAPDDVVRMCAIVLETGDQVAIACAIEALIEMHEDGRQTLDGIDQLQIEMSSFVTVWS